MGPLGFVGGTGAEGLGLATRLAAAGEAILVGSRVPARAAAAAAAVRAAVPGAEVEGVDNDTVLERTDRVVLALPFAGLAPFLAGARPRLAGALVIDVVVPLVLRGGVFRLAPVPGAGSVGELIQQTVPAARVVSAFKNLPAARLRDLRCRLEGDVLLCGEDRDARAAVAALVAKLPGLRPVDAGALANAHHLESLTALLLNLNRIHGAQATIAVLGLPLPAAR
jgi:hypothetical protein